jgi:BNR repeat-like domain
MLFETESRARHGIVWRSETEFCGWPHYCGLWKVKSGELVVGFKRIAIDYRDQAAVSHNRLTYRQGELYLIRSSDNGCTWDPDSFQPVHRLNITAEEIEALGLRSYEPEGPLDLSSADTLIMSGAVPALYKPDSQAWLRASEDGGKTWRRPILLPLCGLPALTGNSSSMLREDGMHLMGLTVTRDGGWTNQPIVYASSDGMTWRFLSTIVPTADDGSSWSDRRRPFIFGAIRYIYPKLVPLADGRILCGLRFQREADGVIWTEVHESGDGGRTWSYLSRVGDWGAPGDIIEMQDGRIACVYGYRLPPYGIRSRTSEDGGRTWGPEQVLRDDGGSWDLGYPRVIEHEEGRLLTVYYMNLASDPKQTNGGIRHIAWTDFKPEGHG